MYGFWYGYILFNLDTGLWTCHLRPPEASYIWILIFHVKGNNMHDQQRYLYKAVRNIPIANMHCIYTRLSKTSFFSHFFHFYNFLFSKSKVSCFCHPSVILLWFNIGIFNATKNSCIFFLIMLYYKEDEAC